MKLRTTTLTHADGTQDVLEEEEYPDNDCKWVDSLHTLAHAIFYLALAASAIRLTFYNWCVS